MRRARSAERARPEEIAAKANEAATAPNSAARKPKPPAVRKPRAAVASTTWAANPYRGRRQGLRGLRRRLPRDRGEIRPHGSATGHRGEKIAKRGGEADRRERMLDHGVGDGGSRRAGRVSRPMPCGADALGDAVRRCPGKVGEILAERGELIAKVVLGSLGDGRFDDVFLFGGSSRFRGYAYGAFAVSVSAGRRRRGPP